MAALSPRPLLLAALPLLAGARWLPDAAGERFHVDAGGRIRDSKGRERLFHGTNIVYKVHPFHPAREADDWNAVDSFTASDLALLHEMGYNAIRLNAPWAAVEPFDRSPAAYNETFLDVVAGIVDEAGEYGIYSLIDHHQDAYSTAVCGTGFPSWTAANVSYGSPDVGVAERVVYDTLDLLRGNGREFPAPLHKSFSKQGRRIEDPERPGQPNRTLCTTWNNNNFPAFHFAFQTAKSYEEIYDNAHGKRDRFAQYWRHLARRFQKSRNVLGYELVNEPFAGDLYRYPWNMVPGAADRDRFQRMYDVLANAIAAEDDHSLIFFQSVTWEVVLPIGEDFGFQHVPGGEGFRNRSVLSFHDSVFATPDATYYNWRTAEMKRLGCAGAVTEIGSGNLPLVDTHRPIAGWMHWDYKLFGDWTWDNGGLFQGKRQSCREGALRCANATEVRGYTRVYPMATAGTIRSLGFNWTTAVGWLEYEPLACPTTAVSEAELFGGAASNRSFCPDPTVVFVPERWYYADTGYQVTLEPAGVARYNSTTNYITVYHIAGAEGSIATLRVGPRASPAVAQAVHEEHVHEEHAEVVDVFV